MVLGRLKYCLWNANVQVIWGTHFFMLHEYPFYLFDHRAFRSETMSTCLLSRTFQAGFQLTNQLQLLVILQTIFSHSFRVRRHVVERAWAYHGTFWSITITWCLLRETVSVSSFNYLRAWTLWHEPVNLCPFKESVEEIGGWLCNPFPLLMKFTHFRYLWNSVTSANPSSKFIWKENCF